MGALYLGQILRMSSERDGRTRRCPHVMPTHARANGAAQHLIALSRGPALSKPKSPGPGKSACLTAERRRRGLIFGSLLKPTMVETLYII